MSMVDAGKIKDYVEEYFPSFGVNKQREVTRLFYEIAKRERKSLAAITEALPQGSVTFSRVKQYLMKRRFPGAADDVPLPKAYLPELSPKARYRVRLKGAPPQPRFLYIESSAATSRLARRCKSLFPQARCVTIESLKEYIRGKNYSIADYNDRRDHFFIVRHRFDFFKPCPCTAGACVCGYQIFNLGIGCVYECTYCYLQEYNNAPGIILPSNIEDFFSAFDRYPHRRRLGTGEFSDSLALDHITGFSAPLVRFFKRHPETLFEFKTKSDNVKNLIAAGPCKNVAVAWSLNPQKVIDRNEFYTAGLRRRLRAASDCVRAGFAAAFHFDPIFYYKGWEPDYKKVIEMLFDAVPASRILWISVGTFRFSRRLKKVIENRFPQNNILDEELLPGFDGKLRYRKATRIAIYKSMIRMIRKRGARVPLYLCMEPKALWDACGLLRRKGWL